MLFLPDFQTLREKGLSEEDIAARFFVNPSIVKQRLRLAAVSEKLLQAYADDEMSLDQLMAFSVTSDHRRQEEVWAAIARSFTRAPYEIRRLLTEGAVRASDKRALFVGVAEYEAAGGVVLRDLFNRDEGGWLENSQLLDRLAREKLEAEARHVRAEGWKWVETAIDFPFGHAAGLKRINGRAAELTEEEEAALEALRAEQAKLEAAHAGAGELPEDVDRRLGEIETTLAAFEERPMLYDAVDIASAGAFGSIAGDGRLRIERGFVRPDDEPSDPAQGRAAKPNGADREAGATADRGEEIATEETDDGALRPLSDRLLMELTQHKTLALRDAVLGKPDIAFAAVLHALALNVFYPHAAYSCLEIKLASREFPFAAPGLNEAAYARSLDSHHAALRRRLPDHPADLWDAVMALDFKQRIILFAVCAAHSVHIVQDSQRVFSHALEQGEKLARAVKLDMARASWRPTAENYLSRVPKARILDAVREAKGEKAVELIDHLKKADMAKEAERLIADTGWLPEPLRTSDVEASGDEASSEGAALPAFLSEEDDEAALDPEEPEPTHMAR